MNKQYSPTSSQLITARTNPRFKTWVRLIERTYSRTKTQQALLYGTHLVEVYTTHWGAPKAFLSTQNCPQAQVWQAQYPQVTRYTLANQLFNILSGVANGYDVMAWIDIPQLTIPTAAQFALFLEDIQDAGNLGSILRSAVLAGVDVVYLSTACADAWSPRALRGGQGAQCILPIVVNAKAHEVLPNFAGRVYATAPSGESLYSQDLTGACLFLFGNEGAGLTDSTASYAHKRIAIPTAHTPVRSLNVAVASAVCLFERARQCLAQQTHS